MSNNVNNNLTPRRHVAFLGTWSTVLLDKRNPYIVLFWSIAYGGLGHIIIDKYVRGLILVVGEAFLNFVSHLNLALYYTLVGQFDLAKQSLDMKWFFLYLTVYCFSIIDSYISTVQNNKAYTLAKRENVEIKSSTINSIGYNEIVEISPVLASILSAILPGAGSFVTQRLIRSFVLIIFWVAIAFLSGFYSAIVYTFSGQFSLVKSSLDIQWFLNIPSIWFFAVYEAYTSAIENNKLFRWNTSMFLKREYQNSQFIMPDKDVHDAVYLLSVFEHSKTEEAVTALQSKGIGKDAILAAPVDRRNEGKMLFDSIHSSDGKNRMAFVFILGTIGTILGSIWGFQLDWGPILCGFIGAVIGSIIGLLIMLITYLVRKQHYSSKKSLGVIIIVRCDPNQVEMAQDILWENAAMGVSKLNLQ